MPQRLAWLALFVALRAVIMAACVVVGAVLAALADMPFRPPSSPDWGFGRLETELVVGGVFGLILGITLAGRLGRRRYPAHARILQCLSVVVLAALYMAGSAMEGRP